MEMTAAVITAEACGALAVCGPSAEHSGCGRSGMLPGTPGASSASSFFLVGNRCLEK